jgi:hypothetical protein
LRDPKTAGEFTGRAFETFFGKEFDRLLNELFTPLIRGQTATRLCVCIARLLAILRHFATHHQSLTYVPPLNLVPEFV